ncbi:ALF repeat-containing protein [Kitasatospora sp. NPDC056138]|uniref:ALF repeat-containing protein n=1 Tax=Kitasatospora sp. NPDC056138 TaxID=3345724 RepID=UPI0035D72F30
MKLARVSAILTAVALAPAVLLPSSASAAENVQPSGASAPDTASETKPEKPSTTEEQDRVEILRILADKNTGPGVREAAQKALDGTAQDLRHFLEIELQEQREIDNRVRVSQIINAGGPAVKKAGKAALKGTPQDVLNFLKEGQFTARAEDDANGAAGRQPAPDKDSGSQGEKGGTGTRTAGATASGNGVTQTSDRTVTTLTDGTDRLAFTGGGDGFGGEVGGSAAALAVGAGLVVAARRRAADES